jgi:hypothetical protein
MLLKESVKATDSGIIVQKTYDNDVHLEKARMLREAGVGQTGESRLVGTIPMHIVAEWMKEAGLSWDDNEAKKDVIKRKMLSGDFDKFRVWKGTY